MCDRVVTVIDMSGVNTCPLERFTRLGVILNTLLIFRFGLSVAKLQYIYLIIAYSEKSSLITRSLFVMNASMSR